MMASMSRHHDYERRHSDYPARRDRYSKDADRRGLSPSRFRGSPPPGVFRRRSSEFHDDPRDWTRDAQPSQRSPRNSAQSTPLRVDKIPDQQGRHSAKLDSTDETTDIKTFTTLICDKAAWVQKKKNAVKNLIKLRTDHARSGTRHVEYASVVEIFQNQMKTAENEVASCDSRIKAIDETLASDFASFRPIPSQSAPDRDGDLDKRLMQLQNSTAEAFRNQLDSELNKIKTRFESDLNGLRAQYETSHKQEAQLACENKDLRRDLDEVTQKYHQLEKKIDILEKKQDGNFAALNLRLTVRDEQIDMKFADMESRSVNKSSEKDSDVNIKNIIEGYDSNLSDLRNLLDSTRQDVKSIQDNAATQPPIPTPVEDLCGKVAAQQDILSTLRPLGVLVNNLPNVERMISQLPQLEELSTNLPIIRPLVNKLPSIQELTKQLPAIQKLQVDVSTLSKSARTMREKAEAVSAQVQACLELSKKNEASMRDLYSHHESMSKDVTSVRSSVQSVSSKIANTRSNQESMKNDIISLQSSQSASSEMKNLRSHQDSIKKDVISLKSSLQSVSPEIMDLRSHQDGIKKDVVSLQSSLQSVSPEMADLRSHHDSLKKDVISLQSTLQSISPGMVDLRSNQESIKDDIISLRSSLQSISPKITDDAQQLLERVSEINQILETGGNTLSENDVLRIVQLQLAGLETAQAKDPKRPVEKSTQEPSNAMTEAEVLRIMAPRLEKVENGLVDRFQTKFNGIADGVGMFIDKERTARSATDLSMKELESRVSELGKAANEAQEETAKWKATMDNKLQQQDGSLMTQRREHSILKNHLAQVHHDLGERMNTHQFQILHLDNWANHFGTKQLYNEIVEHMAATIPSGDQVRTLAERVDALEDQADESRIKKRKLMNGSSAMA